MNFVILTHVSLMGVPFLPFSTLNLKVCFSQSFFFFFFLGNGFQRTSHWLQAYSIADALHLQSWKGQARSSYQNWFQNMHESNVPSLVSRFQHVLLDSRVSLLY